MIGQSYSISQNAIIIHFIGGPYDGKSGLFDHDMYDAICTHQDGKQYDYKRYARGRFYLAKVWDQSK